MNGEGGLDFRPHWCAHSVHPNQPRLINSAAHRSQSGLRSKRIIKKRVITPADSALENTITLDR